MLTRRHAAALFFAAAVKAIRYADAAPLMPSLRRYADSYCLSHEAAFAMFIVADAAAMPTLRCATLRAIDAAPFRCYADTC